MMGKEVHSPHPAHYVACCMVFHKVTAVAVWALALVPYLGALCMHLHAALCCCFLCMGPLLGVLEGAPVGPRSTLYL